MKITKAECLEFLGKSGAMSPRAQKVAHLYRIVKWFDDEWPTADKAANHGVRFVKKQRNKVFSINGYTRREFGRMVWAKNEIKRRENVRKAAAESKPKHINCRCAMTKPPEKQEQLVVKLSPNLVSKLYGPEPESGSSNDIPQRPWLASVQQDFHSKALAQKVSGGKIAASMPSDSGVNVSKFIDAFAKLKTEQEEKKMQKLTVENFTRLKAKEAILDFTHKQKVIFAVYCAELVIDIYENKNNNKAPRLAIEAAKEWIENPTEENKKKCKCAANTASTAATAAAYVDDAYRAYGVAAVAAVAARVASDAYVASDAAYVASDICEIADDKNKIRQKIIDKIHEIKNMRDSNAELKEGDKAIVSNDQGFILNYGAELIGHDVEIVKLFSRNDIELAAVEYKGSIYCFRKTMLKPVKTERQKAIEFYLSQVSMGMVQSVYKANEKYYGFAIETLIDSGYLNTKIPPVAR